MITCLLKFFFRITSPKKKWFSRRPCFDDDPPITFLYYYNTASPSPLASPRPQHPPRPQRPPAQYMPHFTRFGRSRDGLKGCNKSEQTQLQNTKEMESSNPHALLLNKLQAMFPAVHIASPSPGGSLSDSLDTMIRSLPRPGFRETFDTISSMKTIVDGQEMRIQINMMELEQPECVGLVRKQSRETECEYEQEHYDMGEWNWNNNLHFEESLHHQFGSFID